MNNRTILDLGCGRNPKTDANHFLDINPNYVKGRKNGKVWDMNKLPLPYDDNTFKKIYIDGAIEHLEVDTLLFLKEIRRILDFQGIVIIRHVPNVMFIYHRLCYMFGRIPEEFFLAHKKHFTYDYMVETIRQAGLKIRPMDNKKMMIPRSLFYHFNITARRFE